jgi:hypothetical protein
MAGFVFNAVVPPPLKPPDNGNPTVKTPKMSFRDILTEGQTTHHTKEKVDLIEKGLMKVTLENGNRLLPRVSMDDKLFQDLCNPWKEALVVKLLGKNVGYNMMKDRLKTLWRLAGGFEIMDVDNGFYMVKCELLADREKIMSDGPWMLFDHYLAVARWTPDFASPHAKVEKTLVWIRFPGLNLLYYDESVLLGIASVVGTPIKVDTNTLKVHRGRFARICVEIDLTLPVVGKVNVNGHWYNVQYEGLHTICGACGCYGHHTRDCKEKPVQPTPPEQTVTHQGGQPESNTGRKEPDPNQNKEGINSLGKESAAGTETHGDWLVVQRRKGKKTSINKTHKGNPGQPSSLANNFNIIVGKGKGKEQISSLKGFVNKVGVGPSQVKDNPKKRRITGAINHPPQTWDPRAKGLHTSQVDNHVGKATPSKSGPLVNVDQGISSPMVISISTPNSTTIKQPHVGGVLVQEFSATRNISLESSDGAQNMDDGRHREDEIIQESPSYWEKPE